MNTYSHPEIEFRSSNSYTKARDTQHITLLDLLEIYPQRVVWKPDLDHTQLLLHFRTQDIVKEDKAQPLLIFFVEDLNFDDGTLEANTTAQWMRQRFGVSPLFFSCLTAHKYVVKTGNASLVRTRHGRPVSLDGIYRFSFGINSPPSHVWFSHSLIDNLPSVYIIHQCPNRARDVILSYAHEENVAMLLRPLAIDAFLAESSLDMWGKNVIPSRNHLIAYENAQVSLFTPLQIAEAVETLHEVSQLLLIIREDLTDLLEMLEYFMKVYQRLSALSGPHENDLDSVHDSFDFLVSKTSILRRWVVNYNERVGIRINLFFNISTQLDNRTNLDIAKLTSKIAVFTQQDSSSMITMASVTMFFLPGTFVSALFSMVFFNTDGNNSLSVGPQWWLFPAITIPLTLLVFAIWLLWKRHRNQTTLEPLGMDTVIDMANVSEKGPS
ncbi:hypothetical protein GALMADRAFT_242505 [Galerina marginata CBS 339.88]|uniref:Uncharacterized protein n=1 Tax=Galerina marginata (strain CBS 339.88) TaxID=685588 RepID=A0A067TCX7_GALM3|nr:hypothetical protein GALMADRAFT_242505 [Galerina marginata CBS 339.88]